MAPFIAMKCDAHRGILQALQYWVAGFQFFKFNHFSCSECVDRVGYLGCIGLSAERSFEDPASVCAGDAHAKITIADRCFRGADLQTERIDLKNWNIKNFAITQVAEIDKQALDDLLVDNKNVFAVWAE